MHEIYLRPIRPLPPEFTNSHGEAHVRQPANAKPWKDISFWRNDGCWVALEHMPDVEQAEWTAYEAEYRMDDEAARYRERREADDDDITAAAGERAEWIEWSRARSFAE